MKERKYPPRRIPKAKLDEGIELCVDNAKRFVGSGASLAVTGDVYVAAILVSVGVEEYGKAIWLKEYHSHNEDPLVVDGAVFKDHEQKIKKAEETLPDGTLFLKSGAFDPKSFSRDSFDIGTPVDLMTRLEQLYVDWSETKRDWSRKPRVEVAKIQNCAKIVSERLAKMKEEIKRN